jgi:hypothetical protein
MSDLSPKVRVVVSLVVEMARATAAVVIVVKITMMMTSMIATSPDLVFAVFIFIL